MGVNANGLQGQRLQNVNTTASGVALK
jgi:hypothetical protein